MTQMVKDFSVTEESGATAIEYRLIAALILVAIASPSTLIGTNLPNTFNTINGKL